MDGPSASPLLCLMKTKRSLFFSYFHKHGWVLRWIVDIFSQATKFACDSIAARRKCAATKRKLALRHNWNGTLLFFMLSLRIPHRRECPVECEPEKKVEKKRVRRSGTIRLLGFWCDAIPLSDRAIRCFILCLRWCSHVNAPAIMRAQSIQNVIPTGCKYNRLISINRIWMVGIWFVDK